MLPRKLKVNGFFFLFEGPRERRRTAYNIFNNFSLPSSLTREAIQFSSVYLLFFFLNIVIIIYIFLN